MELLHNAFTATVAGVTIVVSSIFGVAVSSADSNSSQSVQDTASVVSVCGTAGLVPDNAPKCEKP